MRHLHTGEVTRMDTPLSQSCRVLCCVAVCCSVLQCVAVDTPLSANRTTFIFNRSAVIIYIYMYIRTRQLHTGEATLLRDTKIFADKTAFGHTSSSTRQLTILRRPVLFADTTTQGYNSGCCQPRNGFHALWSVQKNMFRRVFEIHVNISRGGTRKLSLWSQKCVANDLI